MYKRQYRGLEGISENLNGDNNEAKKLFSTSLK